MMNTNKNTPKLRFQGFTDDWEQRKADYIFKSIADKGYPELPVLSASQELGMVYRDQNGIDIQHDKKNETSYKRVLPGQFVIHLRSFQGGFAYSEVEGITSPAYTVMSFKNPSEQYGLFWKHVFKSETFIKRLETITYGIRDGRSISFSDFKSLILQYPSFSEQKLIGDSIAVIERGITLHQRKLEKLKLAKKALLQKLFPKNGSQFPEIRFKDFTDDWEQCKLSDVADVRDGTHDSPKFYNDGFPLVTSKNLKDGGIDFSDCSFISEQDFNEINKRSKVDSGDILFGMIGTIGKPAIVEHTGFAIKNVALIKEGNIINNRFIYHLLSSKVFDNYIARENAGGTQKFIALNQIRNFVFLAPILAEQNKIIELLDYISQTITLHQRKLDRLISIKKGLLQQLFV